MLWVLALRSSPLTPAQRQELSEVLLNCAADIRIEDLPDVAATGVCVGGVGVWWWGRVPDARVGWEGGGAPCVATHPPGSQGN